MDIAQIMSLIALQQANAAAGIAGLGSSDDGGFSVSDQTDGILFSALLEAALASPGTAGSHNLQSPAGVPGTGNSAGGTAQYAGTSQAAGPGADYDQLIAAIGQRYGVDSGLLQQVIQAESGFNSQAVSPAGAAGLMQLMPGTAASYGVKDIFDPVQNLNGGTHYLKDLLNKYNGDVPLALAAYNAGPGAVDKYHGVPPYQETQTYVKKITANLPSQEWKG